MMRQPDVMHRYTDVLCAKPGVGSVQCSITIDSATPASLFSILGLIAVGDCSNCLNHLGHHVALKLVHRFIEVISERHLIPFFKHRQN